MANRIKGITVEIGGDTTKLSKALEVVNRDIKGTQTPHLPAACASGIGVLCWWDQASAASGHLSAVSVSP